MTTMTRKKTASLPHLIIDAGPGSGKTTTMIAGLGLLKGIKPSWYDQATQEQHDIWNHMKGSYNTIGFQAFNRAIANELQDKVPSGVEAKTFHSFGLSVLRKNGYNVKGSGTCVRDFVKEYLGYKKSEKQSQAHFLLGIKIDKIIGLLKNNLLEESHENIMEICRTNKIEIADHDIVHLYDVCSACFHNSLSISDDPNKFRYISFDDMIWLPHALGLDFKSSQYDLLICDEAQDLNKLQHDLVCKSGLRLICVGDVRQSIYSFRGADSKSIGTLKDILGKTKRGVKVLPLQTSFRLPKSGVTNVQDFASDLKALPNAKEGTVLTMYVDEMNPREGDLIISRVNNNIFSLAFSLLRKKVPVRIQGREFGNQLLKIIEKCCSKGQHADKSFQTSQNISKAIKAIKQFDESERKRLKMKSFPEALLEVHEEKVSCLHALSHGCSTVQEMVDTIELLFNQNMKRDEVVLLSTIHRAKGLEADTVWFLEPKLVPHKMAKTKSEIAQEMNLKFVAETRHMSNLIYCHKRPKESNQEEKGSDEYKATTDRWNNL